MRRKTGVMRDMGINKVKAIADSIVREVSKIVVGKRKETLLLLTSLLAGGHVLIEGVPGVAKTLLSKAFALTLNLDFNRVQFTPDLLPNDIIGTYIYDQKRNEFVLRKGPIFTNILLVDEINRASPKTQSALLEAMQEKQVTIEGETLELPEPFMVIATLNPIETEGVFPLPEAQLDRFMMKIYLDYPSPFEEKEILVRQKIINEFMVRPVVTREELLEISGRVWDVRVSDEILSYIIDIVNAIRRHEKVRLGVSPRGSVHLYMASKAYALLNGRNYVLPDDVKRLAVPVLAHRIILKPEAIYEGVDKRAIVREILETVSLKA